MRYIIEDKKKIVFFIHWLKCCYVNNHKTVLMICKEKGWLSMQNCSYLNQIASNKLIILSHFKNTFFNFFDTS